MSSFPTMDEVDAAGIRSLQQWMRYLPSPVGDEQVKTMERICERYAVAKTANPGAAVAASKAVGW